MKKKIFAASLALTLGALVLGGGSLAYFTSTATVTNTFTVGKVGITLNEFDFEGNALTQNRTLMPGDKLAKNATIKMDADSEDAWVWMEILIPSALYESKTEKNETNNALHYNQFLDYLVDYKDRQSTNLNAAALRNMDYKSDWQWSTFAYVGETTVGEQSYSRLRSTHKDVMKAGQETSPAISMIYMDADVYYDKTTGKYMIPAKGATKDPATEFVAYDGSWEVIVNAYAMQAAGFANVDAAVAAYK